MAELQQIGSPVLLEYVVDQFVSDAPRLIDTMRTALAERDAGALRRSAHALAGNMAFLGAQEMTELCLRIEGLALGGTLRGTDELVTEAEAALLRARAALQVLGFGRAA